MPFIVSIPQDRHCRDTCRCKCPYWHERDIDNWGVPPTNPNMTMHSGGMDFYKQWLGPQYKQRFIGDIWIRGDL